MRLPLRRLRAVYAYSRRSCVAAALRGADVRRAYMRAPAALLRHVLLLHVLRLLRDTGRLLRLSRGGQGLLLLRGSLLLLRGLLWNGGSLLLLWQRRGHAEAAQVYQAKLHVEPFVARYAIVQVATVQQFERVPIPCGRQRGSLRLILTRRVVAHLE